MKNSFLQKTFETSSNHIHPNWQTSKLKIVMSRFLKSLRSLYRESSSILLNGNFRSLPQLWKYQLMSLNILLRSGCQNSRVLSTFQMLLWGIACSDHLTASVSSTMNKWQRLQPFGSPISTDTSNTTKNAWHLISMRSWSVIPFPMLLRLNFTSNSKNK